MYGLRTDIYGRNACGREHYMLLPRLGYDVAQKSRFSRTGLTGQENRL